MCPCHWLHKSLAIVLSELHPQNSLKKIVNRLTTSRQASHESLSWLPVRTINYYNRLCHPGFKKNQRNLTVKQLHIQILTRALDRVWQRSANNMHVELCVFILSMRAWYKETIQWRLKLTLWLLTLLTNRHGSCQSDSVIQWDSKEESMIPMYAEVSMYLWGWNVLTKLPYMDLGTVEP